MSQFHPENYFEALGALQASRDHAADERSVADKFRDKMEGRAKFLENTGRHCKETGCEDWAQYLRAAMEIWELLGVRAAWIACHRELPVGCNSCGHLRETENEICAGCTALEEAS